ncbi:MAG: hypothetical protein JW882_01485, partial [Deltaproteobacteria bacterium]|nr:hypothetical protein [Deltaproteobacteria bacterium]
MRNFPYKAIFICIFSPPVLYMITLLMLEGYLQKRETSRLNEIIIQNPQYLYDGQVTVQDEINRNVGEYLAQSILYKIGVRIHILIKTRDDRVLYPTSFQTSFQDIPAKTLDYTEVAAENYRILNKGLILTVDVNIRHNSWLSNSILVLYVILSVFIIQQLLKKRLRESEKEDREQKRMVEELSEQLSRTGAKLKEVKEREEEYIRNIEKLKQEKTTLSTDMDGLLDEMEKMETGLASQRALKEETESEILRLKEEIDQMKA